MEISTEIIVGSAIALLTGLHLAFVGWKSKQRLACLNKHGVVIPAKIVRGEWKMGRKGSKRYWFEVSYSPGGATLISQSFEVTPEYFGQHAASDAITHPNSEVRYLPTDPTKAMVVGGSTNDAVLFPIGIVLALGGAVVLGCIR